ncbi:hypothetical protein B0H10DRAFT_1040662 [Mycena sp. CBHHK59/15]|nr:hypothetical protein B0H10DRAFT_1040662 [Mycena sp. CBHHK59/15]
MSQARRNLWRCPVDNCHHEFLGESASQVAKHIDDFHARGYSVKIQYQKAGVRKYRDIPIPRIQDLLACFDDCARTSHSIETLKDHLMRKHSKHFQVVDYSVSEGPIIPDPAISRTQSQPSPASRPSIRRIDFTTLAPTPSRSQRSFAKALKIRPITQFAPPPGKRGGPPGLPHRPLTQYSHPLQTGAITNTHLPLTPSFNQFPNSQGSSPRSLPPVESLAQFPASPDEVESPSSSPRHESSPGPPKRRRLLRISQRASLPLVNILENSNARRRFRADPVLTQERQTLVTHHSLSSSKSRGGSPSLSESEDRMDHTPDVLPPSSLTQSRSNSPTALRSADLRLPNMVIDSPPAAPVSSLLKRFHSPSATPSSNKRFKGEAAPSFIHSVFSSTQELLTSPFRSQSRVRHCTPPIPCPEQPRRSSSRANGWRDLLSSKFLSPEPASTFPGSLRASLEYSLGDSPPAVTGNLTKQELVAVLQDHEEKIGLKLDAAVSKLEAGFFRELHFLCNSRESESGAKTTRVKPSTSAQSVNSRALVPSNPAHVALSSPLMQLHHRQTTCIQGPTRLLTRIRDDHRVVLQPPAVNLNRQRPATAIASSLG